MCGCRRNKFAVNFKNMVKCATGCLFLPAPGSKLRDLPQQRRGALEGRTKRRTAMKTATVASVTNLEIVAGDE